MSATTSADAPRRRYNSSRRALQAAQTRRDVLAAATELFATLGWAGTTLAAIAARAGVAVETVYSGFGSKKALLRAAMDVAVVGDADPVPLAEREEFRRLSRGRTQERLRAGVALATEIHVRSAGVWRAIVEAAGADPEVEAWRAEFEHNRRADLQRALREILGRPVDGPMLDVLWALSGPEVYQKLVVDAGMNREAYEDCMVESITRLTAAPKSRPSR
jgi:AcrR family transcriptional regulator